MKSKTEIQNLEQLGLEFHIPNSPFRIAKRFLSKEFHMSRIHPKPRDGFTLVEIMIVIAIIGVLVAITLPAIRGFQQRAKQVLATSEVSQLANAIGQFKSTYSGVKAIPNEFRFIPDPNNPSDPNLAANVKFTASQSYAATVWPRLASFGAVNGVPTTLNSNQCLMFFLGGPAVFTGAANYGFSTSNSTPFDTTNTNRVGPFYNFPVNRIVNGQYVDPWGTPYIYMSDSAYNAYIVIAPTQPTPTSTIFVAGQATLDTGLVTVNPFQETPNKYAQAGGFQIISAGPNKVFGPGGAWSPGTGAYTPDTPGGDDIANFHPGFLGSEGR